MFVDFKFSTFKIQVSDYLDPKENSVFQFSLDPKENSVFQFSVFFQLNLV